MLANLIYRGLFLCGTVAFLAACSSGGNMTLEPNARKVMSKGSPFVQVNQGGKAMVVETGKTPTTGVHGWMAVQSVSSKSLTDTTSQNQMVVNKTSASYH